MSDLVSARANLSSLAHRILAGTPPDEAAVLAWPLICGPGVAERTKALSFYRDVLLVEVPDAGWRNQLQGFSAHYADRLAKLLGIEVKGIRYHVCSANPTRG
jgi:hypothetical protein